MLKKKDHDSDKLSEQEVINRRVDAMLDPDQPDPPSAAPGKKSDVPPLDIFKDASPSVVKTASTAPEVSGKLLDQVDDEVEVSQPKRPKPSVKKSVPLRISKPATASDQSIDPPKDPVDQPDPLGDKATDEAVEDIATKEGNTLLALQDAIGRKASRVAGSLAEEDRKTARRRRWLWFFLLIILAVAILFALPLTAYTCRWPIGIRLSVTTDILPSVCK